MNKRWKTIILLIAVAQIMIVLAWLVLPSLVQSLPGEVRVRLARVPLGETLLDLGQAPMPTALPVPVNAVAQAQITIPAIATATATPEPAAVSIQPVTKTASDQTATSADSVQAVLTPTPTVTPQPTHTATPVPLPRQARIEGLTIIPQGFNNCGPANLTINLNFYGNPTTQAEAAAFLKPNREDRNVSPWQMVDYVNEQTDMRAFIASGGDIEMLKRLLAAGFDYVAEPIPMRNSTNAPLYYLYFCSPKAVAADIVEDIFSRYR